jgi:DNA primase
MQDTAKYLIHADITADGVVERSDVVGAVFGQTEGLLGDDLDLRDLQDSSKVGRIDVDIDSENGQSFGEITIATSLDKVETAILAASLETIDRVGPCQSTIDVGSIEDVRAAKRREVVDRAKQLLTEAFDGSMLSSQELVEEVRRSIRVEDITEYEGYPAGPRVADSDAIIVVEGRADVLQLLKYGIKTAVAVEGTNVPDAVADLTKKRTVTAFLDGDRGGDLILKELAQVGDVDFVAFAPPNHSVEDLDRQEVMAALRDKVPYDVVVGADQPREAVAATDGSTTPAPVEARSASTPEPDHEPTPPDPDAPGESLVEPVTESVEADRKSATAPATDTTDEGVEVPDATPEEPAAEQAETQAPKTLHGHVAAVIDGETGQVRLLSDTFDTLTEGDADEAFDLVRDAETVPSAVVVDGTVSQRVLDVAAQRGVDQIVAASTGEFVKKPTSVRVRTVDELREVAD